MIQRIQSLYLLIVGLLGVMMVTMPLARFVAGTEEFRVMAFGVDSLAQGGSERVVSTIYMGILAVLATILPFVTLFLYKKRRVQVRLCVVEMILLGGLQLFVGFYLYRTGHSIAQFDTHSLSFSVVDIFPIVGLILSYLALRAIVKDELLVRSLDRIR